MSIDERLIRALNSGRCFALVGSGPSIEVGYPSWAELAERVIDYITKLNYIIDKPSYDSFMEKKKYAEIFRLAERDLGGRDVLVSLLKSLMEPKNFTQHGRCIYDYLVDWPFACYLTTNYDNELYVRLRRQGNYYQVLQNTPAELAQIRDGAGSFVVKLHSDLDHPDLAVITSRDYDRFSFEPAGATFRAQLQAVMQMFTVLIVGHSLYDSDLQVALEVAKTASSPSHPVFMFAAAFTEGEELEFLERFNIHVATYSNSDGSHSQLKGLLKAVSRFVAPRRENPNAVRNNPDPEATEAATSLYIYRSVMRLQRSQKNAVEQLVGPLVLRALEGFGQVGATQNDILGTTAFTGLSQGGETNIEEAVASATNYLIADGSVNKHEDRYSLTADGVSRVGKNREIRRSQEIQAYGQFEVDLQREYPAATPDELAMAVRILKDAVVRVYQRRGVEMASAVLTMKRLGPGELSDIFSAISSAASAIETEELRGAFYQVAHSFIVEPTPIQRDYLTSISQGFFLYHMVGLDPVCARIRREHLEGIAWLCDSSILLPLLAKGSTNHSYALDLFARLTDVQNNLFTTNLFIREVSRHLEWATGIQPNGHSDYAEFYLAATLQGGYRQNLFIDGFILSAAKLGHANFQEYVRYLFPQGQSESSITHEVEKRGIRVLKLSQLAGFVSADWEQVEEAKQRIQSYREERGSWRSELQVQAEAELLQTIRGLRADRYRLSDIEETVDRYYFLSHSRFLDSFDSDERVITWPPEALYRYLIALPGNEPDPTLLQQCMLNEYYATGVDFIDKQKYEEFFGPLINTSRLDFEEQKQFYADETELQATELLDEAFENTPDLRKPLFATNLLKQRLERVEREKAEAIKEAARLSMENRDLQEVSNRALSEKQRRRRIAEEQEERNRSDPKRRKKRENKSRNKRKRR